MTYSEKKPSDTKLKISFFTIIVLIVLSIILIVNSFISMEKRVRQISENQLFSTNEYVVNILEQNVERYRSFLEEFSEEIQLTETELSNGDYFKKSRVNILTNNVGDEIKGIMIIDLDGQLKESVEIKRNRVIPQTLSSLYLDNDPSLTELLDNKTLKNSSDYFINKNSYINLYEPMKSKNGKIKGFIVLPLSLNTLYNEKLTIINSSFNGYTMVKNAEMEVVMHPVKEQIGLSIIEDRQQKFPELDFSGLKKLEKSQKSKDTGSVLYESYWWDDKDLKEVLKLSVFRWMTIGNAKFVVATNADVDERKGIPLLNKMIIFTLLVIIILLLLLFLYSLNTYQEKYQLFLKVKDAERERNEQEERFSLEKTLLHESKLETIGIVTTTIVHDLNNILTPLVGLTQLLMEEHATDDVLMSDLESIYSAAEKGQDLSKNILRFSKVEKDRKAELNDIGSVTEDAINTIRPLIPKNVELNLELEKEGTIVSYFDKQDLQVILYNLITNSYQAIGKETGNVNITVCEESKHVYKKFPLQFKDRTVVVVKVMDDGPGIPKDIQQHVLEEKFFSTKDGEGGTGLGLFIVRSIVQKYGWQIDLFSENEGTTFSIYIPV
ncbi:MAG: sensor histidine kinase [Vagococcus sp.]